MKYPKLFIFALIASCALNAQQIPDITLSNMEGKNVNVQRLSKSKTLKVFSFWATWCVPCINELDAISEVYEDWVDETGVEVIAVSTDDSRTQKRVRPLVNGKDWDYQILLDKNQDFKRALNIPVLPHLVVVKQGKIIYRKTNYTPGSEEELYDIILEHSN